MLNVVERIVDKESEFGSFAKLIAHTLCKLVTHAAGTVVDALNDFVGTLRGENAEVGAGDAQVGLHAHCAHRHQHTAHLSSLHTENLAKLLLEEACYFLLSCSFHLYPV